MQSQPSLCAARRPTPWLVLLLALWTWLAAACSDNSPLAPVISVQTADTSVAAGTAAAVSVTASGSDIGYRRIDAAGRFPIPHQCHSKPGRHRGHRRASAS